MSIEEQETNCQSTSSQFALACQYEFGRHVPLDQDSALCWYRKAAEQIEASKWANWDPSQRDYFAPVSSLVVVDSLRKR